VRQSHGKMSRAFSRSSGLTIPRGNAIFRTSSRARRQLTVGEVANYEGMFTPSSKSAQAFIIDEVTSVANVQWDALPAVEHAVCQCLIGGVPVSWQNAPLVVAFASTQNALIDLRRMAYGERRFPRAGSHGFGRFSSSVSSNLLRSANSCSAGGRTPSLGRPNRAS